MNYRIRTYLLSALLGITAGCASHTALPRAQRLTVSNTYVGRSIELKQSCYFGDLYDENEKWLLSPHPFSDTHHILDLDGNPIHPTGQRGIIPAGTRFAIKKVEFPDTLAMAGRMLTSPRYNTWLYLTPTDRVPDAASPRRHFILLLPLGSKSAADVERAINKLVAPTGEVTTWLELLKPSVRVAIEHKDIVTGMSRDELVAAMGEPPRWIVEQTDSGSQLVAWYPSREVWMRDDHVVEIKTGRSLNTLPPPPKNEQTPPSGTSTHIDNADLSQPG